ncbi:hypothetical protein [Chitinibacter sp. ZOR0017]|uniref:hypothetical protein n=1 Tax=Chitinibacter sp. ZOR0017 TaxID=1339254 RepID=UPI0006464200|nr:hypothetical protein [Chitinibacter sp. ZOR0017]
MPYWRPATAYARWLGLASVVAPWAFYHWQTLRFSQQLAAQGGKGCGLLLLGALVCSASLALLCSASAVFLFWRAKGQERRNRAWILELIALGWACWVGLGMGALALVY